MTVLQRIWSRMQRHPLLALLAIVAAQTQFALSSRALWFSDEVRYANAYENMERMGAWVVLALNGQSYPDKPPLYFWLLSLLDKITALDPPAVFFLGSALTGLGFLYATYFLGRSLRMDTSRCLAGSLIVSTAIFFAAIMHYSRMDLMFAALIVASMGCLARSFVHGESGKWTVLGLALTGVAVLVKGPLGVLFPLIALIAYLAWRGEMRRFVTLPVLLGFLAASAVAACWVGAAYLVEGPDFVRTVFVEQIFKRAANTFHHKEGIFYYFAVLPAVWLPWTFFAAGLPLKNVGKMQFWKELVENRKTANAVRTWLWVMLLSAFALLSGLSGKVVIYLLPLFAPLALLTADMLPRMGETARARSWTGVAAFLALFSIALPFANSFTQWPADMAGLPLLAVILMTTACGVYMMRRTFREALLVLTLGITIWIIPATLITAPSLDSVMSPKASAELMGKYMRKGYVAAAYDTYSGIYTYYAGTDLIEIPKHFMELDKLCAENSKVIIAMKKKHLKKWTDRPAELKLVHEQWITDQPYILLEWTAPGS